VSTLLRLYPGDRIASLAGNVLLQATAVALLTLLLCLLARRNPAFRFSVCLCALACLLAAPCLAVIADFAGLSIVNIPLASAPQRRGEQPGVPKAADPPETPPETDRALTAPAHEIAVAEPMVRLSPIALSNLAVLDIEKSLCSCGQTMPHYTRNVLSIWDIRRYTANSSCLRFYADLDDHCPTE